MSKKKRKSSPVPPLWPGGRHGSGDAVRGIAKTDLVARHILHPAEGDHALCFYTVFDFLPKINLS